MKVTLLSTILASFVISASAHAGCTAFIKTEKSDILVNWRISQPKEKGLFGEKFQIISDPNTAEYTLNISQVCHRYLWGGHVKWDFKMHAFEKGQGCDTSIEVYKAGKLVKNVDQAQRKHRMNDENSLNSVLKQVPNCFAGEI